MAQQIVQNQESGLNARNAINDNFTELYGVSNLPVKLIAVNANTTVDFQAGSYISGVSIVPVSGSPIINIGTTPNGGQIINNAITEFEFIEPGVYFTSLTTIYITFTGTGSVSIRFDYIPNYF